MHKKRIRDIIFEKGIWVLPLSFSIAFALGLLKTSIRRFGSSIGTAASSHLTATELFHGLLITVIPVLIVGVINAISKKYFGKTNFDPWYTDPAGISKDKRTAMEAPVARSYLSAKPNGFTVGKTAGRYVRIPNDPQNILHTLVVGSPGSWKSTTLLNPLIYNFQFAKPEEKMTVFAIDVKPELQRKSVAYDPTGEKVRVINPSTCDPIYFGWDAYYGLSKDSTDDQVEERADLIARSLINCKEGSDNEIFYNTARNLMVAFLIYGFFSGKGFLDSMLQLMSMPMKDLIAEILTDKKMIQQHPKLRLILQSYDAAGDKNEMLKDAENTMHEKLRIFGIRSVQYMLRDNPKKASPKDLTNNISIFLSLPDHLLKQYAPLFNMMTQQTLNYLGSIPEWERADRDVPLIWILIDEFGSIGHMDIEGALARLRSRKVCIWLCCQGLSQLDDTYGQNGRRSIVTDCEATLIFSSKDDVANKFFSEISGQYQETKISKQRNGWSGISSISQNISTEFRPVFDMSDFVKLRKDHKLIGFVDGSHFYIDKCPYFRIKPFLEASEAVKKKNDQLMGGED